MRHVRVKRTAKCICPIFLLRFPRISETDLLRFISRNETILAEFQEALTSSIKNITNP